MDDGANGDSVWFFADSRGGGTTDQTLQVYASAAVGALLLGSALWWWAPTELAWLNIGIGAVVGAVLGFICWSLLGLARTSAKHRQMVRMARSDPDQFRRRYGPPNS